MRDDPLKAEFPSLYRACMQKDCCIQEIMSKVNGNIEWNLNFVQNLNDWEISEYARLLDELQCNTMNFQNPDKMRRTIEHSGIFSIKSFVSWLVRRDDIGNLEFPEKI